MLDVARVLSEWRLLICRLTGVHGADSLVLQSGRIRYLLQGVLGDVIGVVVIYLSIGYLRHTVRLMNHTLWYLKQARSELLAAHLIRDLKGYDTNDLVIYQN